ncbi:MAG: methylated-DNA--[protein]-cysteine S-methyltransferase, partial [Firmicutes bacterium]|nr:methylated-DNA--[protein]-cysteine S-methyltransferase [Bacillota bacterium]
LLPSPARDPGPAGVLLEEIERYFSGEKVSFSSPVDWTEYTPFQRLVLEIVKRIPYGEVSSYGRVAGEAGAPRAARAVGGVMRSNRTPLVVPCHRVLAADGSLGGFTGGLEMKRYLLNLERASLRQN